MDMRNHDLKEDIRDYWSERSRSFDHDFGHRIPQGPEHDAWARAVREAIGPEPKKVLELACGTGEVTRVLLSLGHEVTGLDFSEAMLGVARAKHEGNGRARFILADAERTMEPGETYDAVICRHLVWTLTEPERALDDWFRVLKPGGRLVIFDGDWARPTQAGRLAALGIRLIERFTGADPQSDAAMSRRHASIMARLPFCEGLTAERLRPLAQDAGFEAIRTPSHRPITAAQRRTATLRDSLRTRVYRRFILVASRPTAAP
ncbi:MAG: methyltransferase domain-containing protein [Hoeflea sp.]|uniref:class I SAM-dependent methyltransferase n=1 Tax=Hoeflea sp. TaxID=1940281 RepID=UPI0027316376|nr:methyltransferase domain-containing protein [Hoeflea sp.]MDP2121200.1 methyltransferase domain-containing protein [Hoeflea sp.]